ncbi:MAG: efflux RND transporter permease subunit, partial [Planctomycetota bacterium]
MTDLDHKDDDRGAIAWMARHSVAPNLLMMVLLIGGFFMSTRIKQEVFPEFSEDIVSVTVPYPGASPEEIEQGIILAVEEAVRGLDGIKEVNATANEGMARVMVELLNNANEQQVYQEIKQEIDRIRTIPEDAEEPEVMLQTYRRQVLVAILYGDADEWVLRELTEQVRDRLLQDPEITQIELFPYRIHEVSIEVPQENLRAYNLTLDQIANKIRRASIELPGGSVKTTAGEILLRMKDRRDYAREFGQIPIVTSPAGTELRVCDLGEFKDTFEETDQILTYNGKPATSLEVFRVGDQTPIGVSDAVRRCLAEIERDLPPGIHLDVQMDMSKIYRQRLDLLLRNGFLGLILVLAILSVFLEYRLAFWVTIGIPISFLGAFLFLPGIDVSINMISMFAFILTLGIVVDDAIVAGENIYEYRQKGMGLLEASIRGARDVSVPVIFSILTNVAAFAPLAFVPGMMGKFFRVIPLVVATVFMISLIESLLILPAHLAHSKSGSGNRIGQWMHHQQQRFSRFIAGLIAHRYGPLLGLCLRYRYLTVATSFAVLILVLGYVASGRIGFVMMPKVDADEAFATAVLPYGSPVSRVVEVRDRLLKAIGQVAEDNGNDNLVIGYLGMINENKVDVSAYLTEPEIRPINTTEVTRRWREQAGSIKGLESIKFQSDRHGPGSGAALTIELAHRDIGVLDRASEDLAASLAQFANVKDIDDGYTPGKQQLDFNMLPEGRSLGLRAGEVARQLRSAFYGAEALRQQRGRNEIKVMVRLPKYQRISEYDVEELII